MVFLLFYFSKVDIDHFFSAFIFSKVDMSDCLENKKRDRIKSHLLS